MTTLYRLFDAKAKLLYVGISDDWPIRLKQHSRSQDWFGEVRDVRLVEYPDREGAEQAEREAIDQEHPKYNTHFRQPVLGGDAHRLRWKCAHCDRSITSKHVGWLCISEREINARPTQTWHTLHEECTDFTPGFVIPTTRLKTVYDLIDWTCHLATQPWFSSTNWKDVIAPHRALYLSIHKHTTRKGGTAT